MIKENVEVAIDSCHSDHKSDIDQVFRESKRLFEGLGTEPLQTSYIKQHFVYVPFQEIPLGNKLAVRKKGAKHQISEIEDTFIYVPIIDSLKQLLSNAKLRRLIMRKPTLSKDNVFFDLPDGSIYRNDDYFKEHNNALMIVLYHDELEVCNPLGSKAGIHKVDMYYYTIANLSPKYRSKHSAVRLLAIANSKLVREYGIDKILEPIINDLQELYRGVTFQYKSERVDIFGKVMLCTGDTLGQHLWGGFKEGVGSSFQKCRHCYCDFDSMQTKFSTKSFKPRTKSLYEQESNAVINAVDQGVKHNLSLLYGITHKSSLTGLPSFDITRQLPQDIMHTIAEGVLQYEVRLILLEYIQNSNISLPYLNAAIKSHNYGYSEISDKPCPLRESVFIGSDSNKLKYNAAQARLFLRLLPFYISSFVNKDDDLYSFIIELIQIVQIIYSPLISKETIHRLKQMIENHLTQFTHLFPSKNIIPKQHYMIHIPDIIKLLGPPVRYSCYSFEAAHKYFKAIAQKQNFKNLCLSLAKRYQRLVCIDFDGDNGNDDAHPLFASEIKYGVLNAIAKSEAEILRNDLDDFSLLPGIELTNTYRLSWVILHGTKYAKEGVLMVSVFGNPPLPIFGTVKYIWMIREFIYFQVSLLNTLCFERTYQSYLLEAPEQESIYVCSYESLVDYNVFHLKQEDEKLYLPLKYDTSDLMVEYSKDAK